VLENRCRCYGSTLLFREFSDFSFSLVWYVSPQFSKRGIEIFYFKKISIVWYTRVRERITNHSIVTLFDSSKLDRSSSKIEIQTMSSISNWFLRIKIPYLQQDTIFHLKFRMIPWAITCMKKTQTPLKWKPSFYFKIPQFFFHSKANLNLPPQTLITNNYGQKKLKEPSCIKPLLNSGQNIPPTNKKKGIVVIIIFTKIIMVLLTIL
jgi:hypothetical protein